MSQNVVTNEARSSAVGLVSGAVAFSTTPTSFTPAYTYFAGANAYANTHKHGGGGTWSTIG